VEIKEAIKPEESKITDPVVISSIVIDVYSNGERNIHIDKKDNKTVDIPLSYIRETLNWAEDVVNDKLQDSLLRVQLSSLMKEKIIKPGFRPMSIWNKLRGK